MICRKMYDDRYRYPDRKHWAASFDVTLLVAVITFPPGGRVAARVGTLGVEGGYETVVSRDGSLQSTRGLRGDVHQDKRSSLAMLKALA